MTISRQLATSAFAALALLVAAIPASAASNNMPGSACQAATASGAALLTRGRSVIENFGDQAVTIHCPIERHRSRIVSAEVMLIDKNPANNADIICRLETINRDGTPRSTNTQGSNSSFNVALPITFPDQLTPVGGGYYVLRCDLPPAAPGFFQSSGIVGYTVVEQ